MVKITRRDEWGMDEALLGPPLTVQPWELWLHHSVTQLTTDWVADMRVIERVGIERFGRFSYSWAYHALTRRFIEGAGSNKGAHTKDRNSFSLGLVLVGNYDNEFLDHSEILDLVEGIDWLENTGRLARGTYPTGGHRDLKATSCPGQHAYDVLDKIRTVRPAPPPLPEDDDMKASLSWLKDPEKGTHLYLVDGTEAAHIDGQDAKAVAIMRGAVPDVSTRENPHSLALFHKAGLVTVLNGPLQGR